LILIFKWEKKERKKVSIYFNFIFPTRNWRKGGTQVMKGVFHLCVCVFTLCLGVVWGGMVRIGGKICGIVDFV